MTNKTAPSDNSIKRVTLAFRESVWNDFCSLAHMQEQSPSQILTAFMEQSIKTNKELINKHEEIKRKIKNIGL